MREREREKEREREGDKEGEREDESRQPSDAKPEINPHAHQDKSREWNVSKQKIEPLLTEVTVENMRQVVDDNQGIPAAHNRESVNIRACGDS